MSRCQDVKRGRGQGVKGRVLDEPFFQNLEAQICACSFLQPCNIYQGCRKEQAQILQKVAKDYILIYFVSFVVCHVFFWEIFGSSVVLVKLVY